MNIVTEIAATPPVRRRQILGRLRRLVILALLAGTIAALWLWPIHLLGHTFEALVAPMPILMRAAGLVATIVPLEGVIASTLTGIVMTLAYGICLLALLAVAYAVLVLVTPRKPLVLYLRKFGLSSANSAISDAVHRDLGSRYRLVTLDDSRFLPIDVEASVRHAVRLPLPVVVLTILVIVAAIIVYGISLWGLYSISLDGIGGLGLAIAAAGLLILVELLVPFSGFVLAFASIMQHFRRVRRHGKSSIANTSDLSQQKERWLLVGSRALSPGFMAPRAAVVTTADDVWQPTVQAGIAASSAAIMDVSHPSENVLWELEQILSSSAPPVAFIAEETALRTWIRAASADPNPTITRFHHLLKDRTILAYQAAPRPALAGFARSLENHLGNLTAAAPTATTPDTTTALAAALKRRVRATIPLWIGTAVCFWIVASLILAGLRAL